MTFQAVEGANKGKIVVYSLSTCQWCKMTKTLLKDLGVAFTFVDVDTLEQAEKETARAEVRKWNKDGSYPTIVINDTDSISGYDETEIREKIK